MKKHNKHKIIAAAIIAVLAFNIAKDAFGKSERYLMSRAVKLQGDHNMCSGEAVQAPSGESYILTAAHCKILADKDGLIMVITEDGRSLKRRQIAEDPNSDLLLIEGMPGLKGLSISSKKPHRGEHVRTFTHGGDTKTFKTEGELVDEKSIAIPFAYIGTPAEEAACKSMPKNKVLDMPFIFWTVKVCALQVNELVTTASIIGGSSGGMAVDDSGDLIGVASAAGGGFGYLVPLKDIKKFLGNY